MLLTPPMCPPTTVERRRRDKINNWIVQLSKIIPDCSMENTKSGQVGTPQKGCRGGSPVCPCPPVTPVCVPPTQSKGGILSKACDYIQELRQSNHRLSEELQGLDQLQMDNEVLRQQVTNGGGAPWGGVCMEAGSYFFSPPFPPRHGARWRI